MFAGNRAILGIEHHQFSLMPGSDRAQSVSVTRSGNPGIVEHKRQSLRWIFRIERNIRSTSFDDRQKCDNRLERAPQTNSDQGFGRHALGTQIVGQPVCLFVQRLIREPLVTKNDRRRLRNPSDLLFEQRVDRAVLGSSSGSRPSADKSSRRSDLFDPINTQSGSNPIFMIS